jgi:hypothetical protein
MSHAACAMLLFAASIAPCGAQDSTERPPIVVHLADGSSVPLRQWSLSYEYFSWPQGRSQAEGTAARTASPDLWVGKKTVPLRGSTLAIEYEPVERERDVDGETRKVKVPAPHALKLVEGGEATVLKPEPPHRELLAPSVDKKMMVVARSLDLRGESLTGTKMDFCLLSYTSLVECGETPDHQVTEIQFP